MGSSLRLDFQTSLADASTGGGSANATPRACRANDSMPYTATTACCAARAVYGCSSGRSKGRAGTAATTKPTTSTAAAAADTSASTGWSSSRCTACTTDSYRRSCTVQQSVGWQHGRGQGAMCHGTT
jgi:hypothetical protein